MELIVLISLSFLKGRDGSFKLGKDSVFIMKYFAYGSNMNPERMKERGIIFSKREYGILEGFRLAFNKIASRNPKEGYANITEDKNSKVEGILYEINDSDIEKLDYYEGYPEHYLKRKVNVKLKDGKVVSAITYIANPKKTSPRLKPTKEYLVHLIKGSDLLSSEYRNWLKNVETL